MVLFSQSLTIERSITFILATSSSTRVICWWVKCEREKKGKSTENDAILYVFYNELIFHKENLFGFETTKMKSKTKRNINKKTESVCFFQQSLSKAYGTAAFDGDRREYIGKNVAYKFLLAIVYLLRYELAFSDDIISAKINIFSRLLCRHTRTNPCKYTHLRSHIRHLIDALHEKYVQLLRSLKL